MSPWHQKSFFVQTPFAHKENRPHSVNVEIHRDEWSWVVNGTKHSRVRTCFFSVFLSFLSLILWINFLTKHIKKILKKKKHVPCLLTCSTDYVIFLWRNMTNVQMSKGVFLLVNLRICPALFSSASNLSLPLSSTWRDVVALWFDPRRDQSPQEWNHLR